MTVRATAASTAVCALLVGLVAQFTSLSLAHAMLLAPLIVVCAGAAAGLVVIWSRAVWESVREQRHLGRWLAGLAVFVAAVVAMALLGVQLPRE